MRDRNAALRTDRERAERWIMLHYARELAVPHPSVRRTSLLLSRTLEMIVFCNRSFNGDRPIFQRERTHTDPHRPNSPVVTAPFADHKSYSKW